MQQAEMNQEEAVLASSLQNSQIIASLSGIRRGVEREFIRTTPQGDLSQKAHPKALGAALTHPYITTDFAEAQVELVTPAVTDKAETFGFLSSLHRFVADNLAEGEVIWSGSMPPVLPEDDKIAIANYGSSNAGRMKMLYREGLANRYGKRMQTISGIHYNFSLPDSFWQALHVHEKSTLGLDEFISDRYFHLIRNVMRHGWVIPYLFGASPAVDVSYLVGKAHSLNSLDKDTFYLPWATSLRLSNLGYTNDEQSRYPLSYNNKSDYLNGLCRILSLPSERYLQFGEGQQLNTSVLQLENELYGSVRPKIVSKDLRPLDALCRDGVKYIELRSVDNNPYLPVGLSESQSHFLDMFLTYCALAPSPELTSDEQHLIQQRQQLVATQGRKPGLLLPTLTGEQGLREMGLALLASMKPVAAMFDASMFDVSMLDVNLGANAYRQSLEIERAKFEESKLTPSAQILADMKSQQASYRQHILNLSRQHMIYHKAEPLDDHYNIQLNEIANDSLFTRRALEAEAEMSFDQFLNEKNTVHCGCD
ncbi:glutamate--cysteine ligase [Photobacterium sanctipauli]|uniref:Glutamate--cysteine ligase n=1 Tax=Photobacterium sanctipauli TaxID=1342794 RepID=A0A2T3NW41_9GAMM|nr:glutamate--cysteine ligase [Photobacterium sanctipauli]PSW20476.1 glutamate--cysteine ligase [Photobacterium sanctipauli]